MKRSFVFIASALVCATTANVGFAANATTSQEAAENSFSSAVDPDLILYRSGPHVSKTVATSTKPRTISSEEFEKVPGAKVRVRLPVGTAFLVNATFAAETNCSQPDSSTDNWCEATIEVNGVEAEPSAVDNPPNTFAMDSTDSGNATSGNWQAHSFSRHLCVRGSQLGSPQYALVQFKGKVTNHDNETTTPTFWIDDWSLVVEIARGCRVLIKEVVN